MFFHKQGVQFYKAYFDEYRNVVHEPQHDWHHYLKGLQEHAGKLLSICQDSFEECRREENFVNSMAAEMPQSYSALQSNVLQSLRAVEHDLYGLVEKCAVFTRTIEACLAGPNAFAHDRHDILLRLMDDIHRLLTQLVKDSGACTDVVRKGLKKMRTYRVLIEKAEHSGDAFLVNIQSWL